MSTTTADDLVAFLLARIAEDEAAVAAFCDEFGETRQWRADDIGGTVRDVGPVPFGLPDVISESPTHMVATHIARWDPARVLAECEAKRALISAVMALEPSKYVRQHVSGGRLGTYSVRTGSDQREPLLRLLALPFATHPDYQQEWKP